MWLSTLGLIITLALAILWPPLVATAQQPGKVYRIGCLSARLPPLLLDVFRQQLHELGWIEGQNIVIEYRSAEKRFERLPALATELVQQKVDLILVGDGAAIVAAK